MKRLLINEAVKRKRQLTIDFIKAGLTATKDTKDIFDLVFLLPDNIVFPDGHIDEHKILIMLFMKRYRQIIADRQNKDLEDKIVLDLNEYMVLIDVVSSLNVIMDRYKKYKGINIQLKQELINAKKVIEEHKKEKHDKFIKRSCGDV